VTNDVASYKQYTRYFMSCPRTAITRNFEVILNNDMTFYWNN